MSDGAPAGSGQFTLDLSRRRQAYEALNRQAPHAYMVNLLRALCQPGLGPIEAHVSDTEIRLEVPSASFGTDDVAGLYDFLALGSSAEATNAGSACLRLACLLLSCRPDLRLLIQASDTCLHLDGANCQLRRAPAPSERLTVSVRATGNRPRAFTPSLWRMDLLSWRVGLFWPEWVRALELWRFPPCPLQINGALFQPRYFGRGTRRQTWLLGQGFVAASGGGRNRLSFPVAVPGRSSHIFQAGRDSEGNAIAAGHAALPAVWGWKARMRDETTGRGTLYCCADGFVLETYEIYAPGLSMVLDLSELATDASGLRFVQSQALDAAILEFQAQMREELGRAIDFAASLPWHMRRRKVALQRMLDSLR